MTNFTLDVKKRWQFNSVNCTGAGLGTSNYSLACGLVYDWCYDALTDKEKAAFRDGFNDIVNKLYLMSLNHPDDREESDWWVYNYHSNWSGVCHAAQGIAALAFYNESAKARRAVSHAERHIKRFFEHNIGIDGGCAEGIMYARYGLEYALYFFVASCRFFGLDQSKRDTIKLINDRLTGYWDMYMLAPDLGYANFGNMDEEVMRAFWTPEGRRKPETAENEGPNGTLCAFFDSILPNGDPLLRWGADVGGTWYIWEGACPFHLLWRKDDALPTREFPVKLQDAVLFRDVGQAVIRSGNLWLAFNGGLVSPDSHFNRDLGSFILVSKGERLVNDPGYGDSWTQHHSTLLVNGYGQIKNGYGKILCFDKGQDFYALTCDLTYAYDPLTTLDKFIRHMIVIKDKYVLILDEVETDSPVMYEWMLQARNPLHIEDNTAIVTGKTQKLLIAMADTEQPVSMSIRPWNRIERRRDTIINKLHVQPVEKAYSHTFVTVLYPTVADTAPSVSFDGETVSVTFDNGITDYIKFVRNDECLQLLSVNDKPLLGLLNPHQRSVVPFRDTSKHDLDETKMPQWILGTYDE